MTVELPSIKQSNVPRAHARSTRLNADAFGVSSTNQEMPRGAVAKVERCHGGYSGRADARMDFNEHGSRFMLSEPSQAPGLRFSLQPLITRWIRNMPTAYADTAYCGRTRLTIASLIRRSGELLSNIGAQEEKRNGQWQSESKSPISLHFSQYALLKLQD